MTLSTPTSPVNHDDQHPIGPSVPEPRTTVIHGRPRSIESEEAYRRSAREQAATDIAAGW